MPESPSPPTAASRIGGRYTLLAELGRGGMASVHRAHDEALDRLVAVKLLHPHLAGDAAFLERFRREARAAAALSHPNVVAVHDWGETREGAYLVLELVEGPTLRDVLRHHAPLTCEEAADVLVPAARGLGAAHAAGLVHRDVKPENLLLGRDGTVKVTDFGLARAVASATTTFGQDVLVGSPHYLSPEAVRGEPLDPRADVYALGVVLFECLTGAPPHRGESPYATAVQHASRPVPAPSELVDDVLPGADDVVRWATAIDRETRYPTGHDFARALRNAVPDLGTTDTLAGILAVPTDPVDGAAPWSLEPDGSPTRMATSVLEPDGDQDGDAAHDTGATRIVRPPRRRSGWLVALVVLALLGASGVGGYLLWDQVLAPVLPVPEVVGEAQDAAAERLRDQGFSVEVAATRHDRDAPTGTVIGQRPTGSARRGTDVALVVSEGPRQIEVPAVTGERFPDARAALDDAAFDIERTSVWHEQVAEDHVVTTDPEPGAVLDEGSTIVVTISRGPEPIEVPELIGRSSQEAREALRGLGLEPVDGEPRHHDTVPEGQVIDQDPDSASTLIRGDEVELVVSAGPAPVEVPAVREQHVEEAVEELTGLGFEVEVDRRGGLGSLLRPGRVFEQDPGPGAIRYPGDTITLYAYDD